MLSPSPGIPFLECDARNRNRSSASFWRFSLVYLTKALLGLTEEETLNRPCFGQIWDVHFNVCCCVEFALSAFFVG
jgi:hypothetical protein